MVRSGEVGREPTETLLGAEKGASYTVVGINAGYGFAGKLAGMGIEEGSSLKCLGDREGRPGVTVELESGSAVSLSRGQAMKVLVRKTSEGSEQ